MRWALLTAGQVTLLAHLQRANRSPAPLPRPLPACISKAAGARPQPSRAAGPWGRQVEQAVASPPAPDDRRRTESWPSLSHQKLLPEDTQCGGLSSPEPWLLPDQQALANNGTET